MVASDEQIFLDLADPQRYSKSLSMKKRKTKEKRLSALDGGDEKVSKLTAKKAPKKEKKGRSTEFRIGSLNVEKTFDNVVSLLESDDLVRMIVKSAQRNHK